MKKLSPKEKALELIEKFKKNDKENALELIEKFKKNDYDWIAQNNLYCIKQHAIVTVDEILNSIYNEDFDGHLVDEIGADDYWNKVKSEIEALEN